MQWNRSNWHCLSSWIKHKWHLPDDVCNLWKWICLLQCIWRNHGSLQQSNFSKYLPSCLSIRLNCFWTLCSSSKLSSTHILCSFWCHWSYSIGLSYLGYSRWYLQMETIYQLHYHQWSWLYIIHGNNNFSHPWYRNIRFSCFYRTLWNFALRLFDSCRMLQLLWSLLPLSTHSN